MKLGNDKLAVWIGFICVALVWASPAWSSDRDSIVARIGNDIRTLSSDEMEGRGPGTDGLEQAAILIRDHFESLGLKGAGTDGAFMRPFSYDVGTQVVEKKTLLILRGPDGQEHKLELGKDYQALATGGSGKLKADVVFAGYGITAPNLKYDDYENADVKGKAVVVIRRKPQQDDDKSPFSGRGAMRHTFLRTKTQLAKKAGAAAVLMVNDPFTTKKNKKDELSSPNAGQGSNIPFAHLKQSVVDTILKETPVKVGDKELASVDAVAAEIDDQLTPMTQPLEGWTAELELVFERVKDDIMNVVGVIEGEGPLADETIVIGAHYDHLGFGPRGSRRPNVRAVHNGADDNATGTAAVMELARRFAQRDKKPARRLVFIAFTCEERGFVGSRYYINNPLFPLDKTVAMINFDMIGHLDNNGLLLGGTASAKEFPKLIEKASGDIDFNVKTSGVSGGSDHSVFYRKDIPILFFFTGITSIYHTPEDDFETINVEGAAQTIDFAERILDEIINLSQRPEFTKVAAPSRTFRAQAYLGILPDYSAGDGITVKEVTPGSPAFKGDMKAGDVIIKIGDVEAKNFMGMTQALRQYKAGQKVKVIVRRGDEERTLDITLGKPGG